MDKEAEQIQTQRAKSRGGEMKHTGTKPHSSGKVTENQGSDVTGKQMAG